MDKLANQLRRDAGKIDARVSDELDRRIAASLHGVTPLEDSTVAAAPRRTALFWWASSLTGIAAAAAAILLINPSRPELPATPGPAAIVAVVPDIDWNSETAVFTAPLQQELDALQSDIRKAEEKVKADIGL